jgi:hypothetical protein
LEQRREILRPIWFADAYSNTNGNCDCHAERDTETYAHAKG